MGRQSPAASLAPFCRAQLVSDAPDLARRILAFEKELVLAGTARLPPGTLATAGSAASACHALLASRATASSNRTLASRPFPSLWRLAGAGRARRVEEFAGHLLLESAKAAAKGAPSIPARDEWGSAAEGGAWVALCSYIKAHTDKVTVDAFSR